MSADNELLVRIAEGTWVDPDTVRSVVSYPGTPERKGWFGRVRVPAALPRVVVTLWDGFIEWRFPTSEAATAAADAMAAIVNYDPDDPDDPEREDVPDAGEAANVVPLGRGRAA